MEVCKNLGNLRLQKPPDGILSLPTEDLDLIPNGSNTPARGWGEFYWKFHVILMSYCKRMIPAAKGSHGTFLVLASLESVFVAGFNLQNAPSVQLKIAFAG